LQKPIEQRKPQKQRAQAPPQQPTRAEKLNKLRQEGLSEAAVSFLGSNHEIMDYPHLADQAARIARDEGYLPDTESFFQAVKSNFRAITTPPPPASSVALEAAEKYSGGGASMPSLHDEASLDRNKFNRAAAMVSAPVSREVPSSSREDRVSSRVTLSLAEKEHARLAGVTETAYAQAKRRPCAGMADAIKPQSPFGEGKPYSLLPVDLHAPLLLLMTRLNDDADDEGIMADFCECFCLDLKAVRAAVMAYRHALGATVH